MRDALIAAASGILVVLIGIFKLWLAVGVATALIIGFVLATFRALHRWIWTQADLVEAAVGVNAAVQPRAPLPPFGNSAVESDTAGFIVSLVLERRPALIIECGSGLSTLLIGYAIERCGRGRILSLDHIDQWATATRNNALAHGLNHVVTVIHAPLVNIVLPDGSAATWYQTAEIDKTSPIDMLIVDGPPGYADKNARFPALPMMWDRLSDGATIIVDDSDRPGERQMVERWMKLYGKSLTMQDLNAVRGLTVLLKKSHA